MKKALFLALVCIMSIGIFQTAIAAPGKPAKKVKVAGKKVDKSRGADPNIKTDRPTTDVVKEKSRGYCSVNFYNYTGYTINVYMDGAFWGTLAPYGNGNVTDGEGYTKIYCVTVGGTYSWSATGDCDHTFEYDLTLANAN